MDLQQLITDCHADYETYRNDPYLSHEYRAKLEELQTLARLLQELGAEKVLDRIREEEPMLQELLEQERDHPTFDMYNEHYHELRLDGKISARKAVKAVLEGEASS